MKDAVPRAIKRLCSKALELGAKEARVIPARSIATAEWVRMKCLYGCDGAGERWTCPPYSPTPEQTRRVIDGFRWAVLLRCETKATRTARELERHAFLQGFYKAWSMGCGPCTICKECDLDSPCKQSGQARPAMEACGVDVFKTVRDNGMKIEVVTDHSQTPRFFGVVLVE